MTKNPNPENPRRNPNIWVPSLYFTQGLPYTVVMEISTIFFKAVGTSLEALGIFQGLYLLPWAFKFVWSPLVELLGTKRGWIRVAQGILAALFFILTFVAARPMGGENMTIRLIMLNLGDKWANAGFTVGILLFFFSIGFTMDAKRSGGMRSFAGLLCVAAAAGFVFWRNMLFVPTSLEISPMVWVTFLIFLSIALLSATQDIAIDGFYLDALDPAGQAAYSGVRIMFYRVAMIFGTGLLVMLAGKTHSWPLGFGVGGAVFAILAVAHNFLLPRPLPAAVRAGEQRKSFAGAFTSYLDQKRIIIILLFIILFRIDDSFWKPMAKPFLMDIGVSVAQIGLLYGVFGLIATIVGTIAGGIYIAKRGLTRSLWILGIIQSTNLLLYAWLAYMHPKGGELTRVGLIHVGVVNALENLAIGLGTIAFVNFLMRTCKKEYTAAHYAIATGLMAMSGMLASFFSGFLAEKMGYLSYFTFCFAASIPGLLIIFFLPLRELEGRDE